LRTAILCPFSAGTVLWQAQSGAWTLSVCVRGTFSLVQGREAVLADPQEPVGGDRHLGDDPRASVHVPSDLIPYKPRADVILVGSAFAPHQQPVEALVARLSVGSLDKAIGVIGDRPWIEGPDGPEPSAPRPFRVMSLAHERAARARDNPHGFDLTRAPALGAPALPNLEAADDEIGRERTVGFGPIAPGAGSRRGLLRAEGLRWVEAGGRGPVPPGFDFGFYNAAPRDQQIDALRSGDRLVLENLNREHARLETRLPGVRPKAFLVPGDIDRGIEIALRCDTLWIDTDRGLLTLSWRGLVTVDTSDEEALGTVVIAAESKGRELGYAHIARILREGLTGSTDGDTFTESRPLRPASVAEIDPDLLPTPGPFKLKRPLPGAEEIPRPAGSLADTARNPGATQGPAAKVPTAAPAPRVIEAEETSASVILDELTGSDLMDQTGEVDPKTLTRIDPRRSVDEEPKTRPAVPRPPGAPAPLAGMGAADYARIAVAVERGDAARALYPYGLGLPDLPAVQRAYSERSASDAAFAQAFAQAVALARRG